MPHKTIDVREQLKDAFGTIPESAITDRNEIAIQ